MRAPVVAVIVLLAACTAKHDSPVDELEDWNGKTKAWVTQKLGAPSSDNTILRPVSDIGEFQGVERRIEHDFPDYKGQVRALTWKKGEDNYAVFIVRPGGDWIVLDAVKWKEGVVF